MEGNKMILAKNDIIMVELNNSGSIQSGLRPCVIVSNDKANTHSPVILIAPLTSRTKKELPTHVNLEPSNTNGLSVVSTVLAEQIMAVNKTSIKKWVGKLNERETVRVAKALMTSLAL
jgi:mRNA interferase MazF